MSLFHLLGVTLSRNPRLSRPRPRLRFSRPRPRLRRRNRPPFAPSDTVIEDSEGVPVEVSQDLHAGSDAEIRSMATSLRVAPSPSISFEAITPKVHTGPGGNHFPAGSSIASSTMPHFAFISAGLMHQDPPEPQPIAEDFPPRRSSVSSIAMRLHPEEA